MTCAADNACAMHMQTWLENLCHWLMLTMLVLLMQFDWEADIAEDEAGQDDFGGGQPMGEAADEAADEEIVAVDEPTDDLGEDAAGAAAQQDDFAKRMAAFADAFD